LDFIAGRLLDFPLGRLDRLLGLYPGLRERLDDDRLRFTLFALLRELVGRL
jgi:hypothetical protein